MPSKKILKQWLFHGEIYAEKILNKWRLQKDAECESFSYISQNFSICYTSVVVDETIARQLASPQQRTDQVEGAHQSVTTEPQIATVAVTYYLLPITYYLLPFTF